MPSSAPAFRTQPSALRLSRIALCAALVVLATFIRIPLGFVPVMFTAQVFMVLTAGLLLGAKDGALALTTYLLLGLVGVPVFTRGGGFGTLATPEGGYLIGFIAAAAIAGTLRPTPRRTAARWDFIAAFAGVAALYAVALPYIAAQQAVLGNPIAVGRLAQVYCLSFLPLDAVKAVLAAGAARGLRRSVPALFAR